ncbi:unnamed protein product [Coffea canephora]|uniref:Uncharacterized protein n=1 Tax=Coffea canephora TaxID=49390 RepID=A0A068VEF9_COFCA|nr:unnamed protein product [Coffea canephora]
MVSELHQRQFDMGSRPRLCRGPTLSAQFAKVRTHRTTTPKLSIPKLSWCVCPKAKHPTLCCRCWNSLNPFDLLPFY